MCLLIKLYNYLIKHSITCYPSREIRKSAQKTPLLLLPLYINLNSVVDPCKWACDLFEQRHQWSWFEVSLLIHLTFFDIPAWCDIKCLAFRSKGTRRYTLRMSIKSGKWAPLFSRRRHTGTTCSVWVFERYFPSIPCSQWMRFSCHLSMRSTLLRSTLMRWKCR